MPQNAIPEDFLCSIKNLDYSSVSPGPRKKTVFQVCDHVYSFVLLFGTECQASNMMILCNSILQLLRLERSDVRVINSLLDTHIQRNGKINACIITFCLHTWKWINKCIKYHNVFHF